MVSAMKPKKIDISSNGGTGRLRPNPTSEAHVATRPAVYQKIGKPSSKSEKLGELS